MTFRTVSGTLSAAVADAATFTASYPAPGAPENAALTDAGDFFNANGHKLVIGQNDAYSFPAQFDVTLGTANITITNRSGSTWPAGSTFQLQLEVPGKNAYAADGSGVRMARMSRGDVYLINLGAPDALVTNGVMAQQNRTNAGALIVNGTLAVGGVVELDKPRNLIWRSGGADTAVVTVNGRDEYDKPMSESNTLSGTTAVNGKKAFKKITSISTGAAIANTAYIGTGNVLGYPVHLPSIGLVLKELQDGTAAAAGTQVAGFRAAGGHLATSADVRGTYTPAVAPDGAKVHQIVVCLPDGGDRGPTQFTAV